MNKIIRRSLKLSRLNSEYYLASRKLDLNKKEIIKESDLAKKQVKEPVCKAAGNIIKEV